MSVEANKALYRRFVEEVINGRNVALVDDLVAEDYVDHSVPPGQPSDREALRQGIAMVHSAVPDYQAMTEALIGEGDLVVGRGTATGTHQGEFFGIPATGKRFTMTEMHMVRVVGGKIVEHWSNEDSLSMMQQLGAIPAPNQAG